MKDTIAEALGMRQLGSSIDFNEGRDPEETLTFGGHMGDEYYKQWSEVMKEDNPMYDPDVVAKVSKTKKERFESGELKGRKLSEEEKKNLSERMKANNPVHRFPEKHNFKNNSYVQGRKWYNNGEQNLYLYDNELIPPGYKRGMKYVARKRK